MLFAFGKRGSSHELFAPAVLAILFCSGVQAYSAERVVYTFKGGNDGKDPYEAALMFDGSGNLIGTTIEGGDGSCQFGCGTVFQLSPDRVETLLHTFTGGSDGAYPRTGVIADGSGNLYGATTLGGRSSELLQWMRDDF